MQLWDTSHHARGPRYPLPVRNKRRLSARALAVSWGVGLTVGVAAAVAVAWQDGIGQTLEPTAMQINWEVFGWPE